MSLNPLVDSRDVKFILFEMLEADKLNKYSVFAEHDRDVFEDTLELAERIAVEHFYPSNYEGDKEGGVRFDPKTNEVKVPEQLKSAWKAYIEAGFIMLKTEAKYGGMGMPDVIATACDEYFQAGNTSLWMYAGLALGAAHLINLFGTEEEKKLYCEKMITGEWGGTMCLTEPEAGTDVGNLKTKAVKQEDGTYLITGQKIFISAGEYDLVDNIIHTVLARIEGHPPGTKGISAFIVPKYIINSDGSLERNDVVCTGIEHKMGIKSSSTTTLNFGDNGKCVGYLLGEEMKGMKIMFELMKMARVETGLQALGQSTAAYMHAVTYARTRKQSVHFTKMLDPGDSPMVPIIEHPDVQRMLLWMKSNVEGMRMLAYYVSKCVDIFNVGKDKEAKKAKAIVDLLRPVVKAGLSDTSWLVTAEAIQVFGGYGYISDYKVEQYARDTKIFSIYEGTNGIQSLDLVFRNILLNEDQYNYKVLKENILGTIEGAKGIVDDKYISQLEKGMVKLDEVMSLFNEHLSGFKFLLIGINTVPFLKVVYMLVVAWLHLWSLIITVPKVKELIGDAKGPERQKIIDSNNEAAYYSGRVLSSQFFIGAEFPKIFGQIECILSRESAVVKTSPAIFTGALEE